MHSIAYRVTLLLLESHILILLSWRHDFLRLLWHGIRDDLLLHHLLARVQINVVHVHQSLTLVVVK